MSAGRPGISQPLIAGVVTATVGFAGAFTVVLAGLRGVGADEQQAASGLLALSVLMGLLTIALSLRTRFPIVIAWSTPGAALLASAGHLHGGFAAAVGAFLVCGLLIVLVSASKTLSRLIDAIPLPLASAMLAGVLLPLCVAPVKAIVEIPDLAAPVVATWLLLTHVARRWAVPAALAAAIIAVALIEKPNLSGHQLAPQLVWTTPHVSLAAIIGIGLPLFIVTMASQNVTGMGVLASFGYRPKLAPILSTTGAATILSAPFGGHAINLAAISAALSAGPDGDPDPGRRWIAAVTSGSVVCVLGLGSGVATAFIAASPPLLVEAVAGLALLGTLGTALSAALVDDAQREAATITFVVGASGMAALGIGGSFWGLVAGIAFLGMQRVRAQTARPRTAVPQDA
jgi:benzoate membrane transport protein